MSKIDSNTAPSTSYSSPELTAFQAHCDGLRSRFDSASQAVQAAVPVRKLSLAGQETFLLAHADMLFGQELFQRIEGPLNGLKFSTGMLVVGTANRFGVSEDLVIPAFIKHLSRQLACIETVIERLEAGVVALVPEPAPEKSCMCERVGCSCRRYVPGEKLATDDPVIIAFSARRDLPSAGR